jgi:hypothetical protein
MSELWSLSLVLWLLLLSWCGVGFAVYTPVEHRPLQPEEIAVDAPGACSEPNRTYVLTRDISSNTSGLFLADGATLDLNGYTVSYAEGNYGHLPNYGFEEGLAHWNISRAPSAKIEDTDKVKPFIGKHILRLSQGEEIVSEYVTLPVANRSYYAMCGVLVHTMNVTVSVEDERGRPVVCDLKFGENTRRTCPQSGSTRLGGGFVVAYLRELPAGKYRARIRANTDCLIDEVDIRPTLDTGIGIVGSIHPWARYENILGSDPVAFPDYAKVLGTGTPLDWLPVVKGPSTITIRNGVIKSSYEGIRFWGVLCSADVKVVLENVRIITSGISVNAARLPRATIRDCRFETKVPFVIERHNTSDYAVCLYQADGSEVSGSEFIGGQGNLSVQARQGANIHDNLFVNHQTVTNHYSLGLGSGVKVFRNRFEPEIGSGILTGGRDNEIFENTFNIVAANGSCEYTDHTEYSTNAIRLTDYDSAPGRGCFGNHIHHNRFHIVGKGYTNYPDYKSIATAIFMSVGGGANRIYENEVTVDLQKGQGIAEACAFYVSASNGGEFENNRITANTPPFWIGNPYGSAKNTKVIGNTITKAPDAPSSFRPFRLGWGHYKATGVAFVGNHFVNCDFGIQEESFERSEYTVE